MKFIKFLLLSICAASLLTTTGCLFPGHRGGGEYREGGGYRGHGEYRQHTQYRSYPERGVSVRVRAD